MSEWSSKWPERAGWYWHKRGLRGCARMVVVRLSVVDSKGRASVEISSPLVYSNPPAWRKWESLRPWHKHLWIGPLETPK